MSSIFKLLSPDCTPELNSLQRDSLLQNKEYIIPGGDTLETTKYELEIDEDKQYLIYNNYFTTGQQGFLTYEVRKFKKTDGSWLIVLSGYGGMKRAFDQLQVIAYKFQSNRLIKINEQVLPEKIDINIFLKANTPDSISKKIASCSSCSFYFSPDLENAIVYRMFPECVGQEFEQYLLGDAVLFSWTGETFKQEKIIHSE